VDSFAGALKIRVAYRQGIPIAAMITLRHKDTLVYKYGCSDARFHNWAAMHLLYWKAISRCEGLRLRRFDLGRTDADQQGLIIFKSRWGATQSVVTYSRYSLSAQAAHVFDLSAAKWKSRVAKSLLSNLPLKRSPSLARCSTGILDSPVASCSILITRSHSDLLEVS